MSADFSTAESFGDEFLEYVEEQGLEFDDIYNADETRLFGELGRSPRRTEGLRIQVIERTINGDGLRERK